MSEVELDFTGCFSVFLVLPLRDRIFTMHVIASWTEECFVSRTSLGLTLFASAATVVVPAFVADRSNSSPGACTAFG